MHEELSRARIDEERVKQKLEVVAQENEKLKAWRDDPEKEIEILKEEINKAEQARAKVLYEAEKERSESQVLSKACLNDTKRDTKLINVALVCFILSVTQGGLPQRP